MSIVTILAFALTVFMAMVWIGMAWSRRPRKVSELMGRIERDRVEKLCPFVEFANESKAHDDAALWNTMGGVRGVLQIHRETGVLLSIAIRVRKRYPEDVSYAARQMFWTAMSLRLTSWACLLEAIVADIVPDLPRAQARSCAYLYCDLANSLEVVLAICEIPADARI
jgi:hypothetical protein